MAEENPPTPAAPAPAAAGAPAPHDAPAGESKGAAAKAKAMAAFGAFKGSFGKGFGSITGALSGGITGILSGLFRAPKAILMAIFGGGLGQKVIALLFLGSLAGLVFSGLELYDRYLKPYMPKPKPVSKLKVGASNEINEMMKLQREQSIAHNKLVFMEKFSASAHSNDGRITAYEVEFALECDEPDTARAIKGKMIDYRDAVAAAVQDQRYEELITDPGKAKLKNRVATALEARLRKNHAKGKIATVHLTKLVVD